MADDLVKRLREKAKNKTNSVGDKWGDWVCDESADRIESLEAALQAADEAISAMNFTVALAHHLEHGEGSTVLLMDEILSAQNRALTAYRKARGGET